MKKYLLPVILATAPLLSGAIAIVNSGACANGANATSYTCTVPWSPAAGNALIVAFTIYPNVASGSSVSDNKGDAVTKIAEQGGTESAALYIIPSLSSGVSSVTVNWSGASYVGPVNMVEVSGLGASPLDQSFSTTDNNPGVTSPSFSTAQADEIVFCSEANYPSATSSASSGYTQILGNTVYGGQINSLEYRILSATGTYTCGFSFSGVGQSALVGGSLEGGGGGPGAVVKRRLVIQ